MPMDPRLARYLPAGHFRGVRSSPSAGGRKALPLDVHAKTDIGKVRENNEDACDIQLLDDGTTLLVVSDGMGGHDGGEQASALTVQTVRDWCRGHADRTKLSLAVRAARKALAEAAEERRGPRRMGATVVLACIPPDGTMTWRYAGDSRLYIVRQGMVAFRSWDHNLPGAMAHAGQITQAEADVHPYRNHLINGVFASSSHHGGSRYEEPDYVGPDADDRTKPLEPGDVVILCSDGVHGEIGDEGVLAAVRRGHGRAKTIAQQLVQRALDAGGEDNATVAVAIWHGKGGSPTVTSRAWWRQVGKPIQLLGRAARVVPYRPDVFAALYDEDLVVPGFAGERRWTFRVQQGQIVDLRATPSMRASYTLRQISRQRSDETDPWQGLVRRVQADLQRQLKRR